MAKKLPYELRSEIGNEKYEFLKRFSEMIKKPTEHFINKETGHLDKEKLSSMFNDFVQNYLQRELKTFISAEKFPKVSVQNLNNPSPGKTTGRGSTGNYDRVFNFIEINAGKFTGKNDIELAKQIMETLPIVCHEFHHFMQKLYAEGNVPNSLPTVGGIDEQRVEENNKTMMNLTPEQLDIVKDMLGKDPEKIKHDFLYADFRNKLLDISKDICPEAYKKGNNSANKLPGFSNGKIPIYAANYLLSAHEVDARETSISLYDEFVRDFESFSNGNDRKIVNSLKNIGSRQKFMNFMDNIKQPKKAMEVFMNNAIKLIKPEDFVEFYQKETQNLTSQEDKEFIDMMVERSVCALLEPMNPEDQGKFIAGLAGKLSDKLMNRIMDNLSRMQNGNVAGASVSKIDKDSIEQTGYYAQVETQKVDYSRTSERTQETTREMSDAEKEAERELEMALMYGPRDDDPPPKK